MKINRMAIRKVRFSYGNHITIVREKNNEIFTQKGVFK